MSISSRSNTIIFATSVMVLMFRKQIKRQHFTIFIYYFFHLVVAFALAFRWLRRSRREEALSLRVVSAASLQVVVAILVVVFISIVALAAALVVVIVVLVLVLTVEQY